MPKPLSWHACNHVVCYMRPESREEVEAVREPCPPDELTKELMSFGPLSWSFWNKTLPVYAGGMFARDGEWWTWGISTPDFKSIATDLTKFVRRSMLRIAAEQGATTLNSMVLSGRPTVARWMELIGAKKTREFAGIGRHGESFDMYQWDLGDVLRGR